MVFRVFRVPCLGLCKYIILHESKSSRRVVVGHGMSGIKDMVVGETTLDIDRVRVNFGWKYLDRLTSLPQLPILVPFTRKVLFGSCWNPCLPPQVMF